MVWSVTSCQARHHWGALHLFTGCGNGYGTVGIAWRGGMCDKRGYNTGELGQCEFCWSSSSLKVVKQTDFCKFSHRFTGVNELSKLQKAWLIFAHELGHNFGGELHEMSWSWSCHLQTCIKPIGDIEGDQRKVSFLQFLAGAHSFENGQGKTGGSCCRHFCLSLDSKQLEMHWFERAKQIKIQASWTMETVSWMASINSTRDTENKRCAVKWTACLGLPDDSEKLML